MTTALAGATGMDAWAREPITAGRLLPREGSLWGPSPLPAPVPRPDTIRTDGLGSLLVGIFEHQVRLPVLGYIVVRPGQPLRGEQPTPSAPRSRLWERLINGFERWTEFYQNSIQVVKTLD